MPVSQQLRRQRQIANSRPTLTNLERPHLKKKKKANRGLGVTQVVQHLPNMLEAVSIIPSTTKRRNKEYKNTIMSISFHVFFDARLYHFSYSLSALLL
jgi:hypothetical protein